MKPKCNFTMEDLLAELLTRIPHFDEGEAMTTAEMADAIGVSQSAMRSRLKGLKKSGFVAVVRKQITTLNDRPATVTAWVAVKREE